MAQHPGGSARIRAVRRDGEQVTPLELFFDLVFVLAITQCTALMSHHPTWSGIAQGLLVLGMLWWAWTGYSWLTSVIDHEEGAVRLVIFGAMAALLLVSLCVPEAFGDLALPFALIYGVVRSAQIAARAPPSSTNAPTSTSRTPSAVVPAKPTTECRRSDSPRLASMNSATWAKRTTP